MRSIIFSIKSLDFWDRKWTKNKSLHRGRIFTKQCLDFIHKEENEIPDRIIVFSDSQDCDNDKSLPKPFGKYNYIVDISSEARGINYNGVWSAEISGWSEGFLKFISESEI